MVCNYIISTISLDNNNNNNLIQGYNLNQYRMLIISKIKLIDTLLLSLNVDNCIWKIISQSNIWPR